MAFVGRSYSLRFVQDDAYITYRYARNVVRGAGPVFNTGERVEGYTNFLWMMLLAALGIVGVPFTTIIPLSQVLGVLCGIGVIIIFFLLIRRHSRGPPLVAPLATWLLAANGSFAYWCVSGMESALFALLCAAAFYVFLGTTGARRMVGSSLLLGLAALTRPEGVLFFGVVGLYFVLSRIIRDRGAVLNRANLGDLARLAVPFLIIVAPLYAWRLGYYGWFFPNTFYAKTGFAITYLKSGIDYFVAYMRAYGFFGLGLLLPLFVALRWRRRMDSGPFLFALLAIAIHAVYTIGVGGDVLRIYRFFVPVYLLYYFVLSESIWLIPAPAFLRTVLVLAVAVLSFWGPLAKGNTVRADILRNRYLEKGLVDKMSVTGRWLNRNLTEQDWFAGTTIGAVSYFSDRNMIDMLGLTDAVVAHHPENILGPRVYWKERNYNTAHVLERLPQYIYFSTGGKPSAAAERALFLRTRFRRGYFACLVSMQERAQMLGGVCSVQSQPGQGTRVEVSIPLSALSNIKEGIRL